MSITTIIFDADYTLYTPESDEAYTAKFRFLADKTGVPKEKLQKAWETVMAQAQESAQPGEWERRGLIKDALTAAGAPHDDELIEDAYSLFWETVVHNTDGSEKVATMLRDLREEGYNLAIATDEFPEPLRMKLGTVLRTSDIESLFDAVITCRDAGKQKPSRKYYELILDDLDVLADECVMVGDSWVRDLAPAKKMGLTTVLVGESDPHGEPDYELNTVTELEDVLEDIR